MRPSRRINRFDFSENVPTVWASPTGSVLPAQGPQGSNLEAAFCLSGRILAHAAVVAVGDGALTAASLKAGAARHAMAGPR
jgi:hypothetical protein